MQLSTLPAPQLKHCNPLGTAHGGWYATLLDSAVGCAVHTLVPAARSYTTAELSVTIVRAASHATGPLRAIGTVIHCGKQLATAEGRIVGPDGKLYAHATTTCWCLSCRAGRLRRTAKQRNPTAVSTRFLAAQQTGDFCCRASTTDQISVCSAISSASSTSMPR